MSNFNDYNNYDNRGSRRGGNAVVLISVALVMLMLGALIGVVIYQGVDKQEQAVLGKELTKLQTNLGGVRDMTSLPQAIFVVDFRREEIGIREANRLHIPVVSLLDTNSDPDVVEYGIPANDDAIRSVSLMCELAADAVLAGTGKEQISAEEMAAPAAEAPAVE